MLFNNCVTYLILVGIIIYCLYRYDKNAENFAIKPGPPAELKVVVETLDTIVVTWVHTFDPTEDPITGHIIMLSTLNNITDSTFLSFSSKTRCDPVCQYRLSNLNLKEGVEYKVSVMAQNNSGSSEPAVPFIFKAIAPIVHTITPANDVLATLAPTPAFLEDIVERQNPMKNIDKQLEDMVARAEGIFEIDKNKLQYADIEVSIKDQLQALNQNLLDDLTSNRINIHLEVNKSS